MPKGGGKNDFSGFSMLELFRMEAETQLGLLTQGLLDIEDSEELDKNLETLMRASHSMKGAARMVELDTIVRLAHVMEDWFVAAQRGKVALSSSHIDLLLKTIDVISQITQKPEQELDDYLRSISGDLVILEKKLNNTLSSLTSTGASVEIEDVDDEEIDSADVHANVMETEDSGDITFEKRVTGRRATDKRKEERVVRVDANRLNQIMGLTSELVVESRWLHPFSDSMGKIKKQHAELTIILENLRESMLDNQSISHHENILLSTAQKKLAECRNMLTEKMLDLDDYDRRNLNLSSRIHDQVINSRMRPFYEATQGLQRLVRDLSRSLGKEVQLVIQGKDTPVDRDVVENIKAPLIHLVRNAVDHGVELPEERKKLGKNAQAKIGLSAHHGGGMLTITVEDNGRGVNIDKLKGKIIQRNLVAKELVENLSKSELIEFLYLPDFTTRDEVTEISGRGVGLDVVHKLITDLHGSINTESKDGSGTKFTLQLPVTLSLISSIVVSVSGEKYAFPLSRIDRLVTTRMSDIHYIEGRQYLTIEGEQMGLIQASQILELEESQEDSDDLNVAIISARGKSFGVVVDEFLGQRELSVQTLDSRLGKIQDISAAALTDEGEPVLIVDVDDMVRTIEIITRGLPADTPATLIPESVKTLSYKKILVIDDSLTVREVEKGLLMNYGYRVDVAIDGMDGWNALRRGKYDLVITDVDMPRMDGIELVTQIKQDARFSSMPIMIVSYKDRQEDRQRGLEAGADYYLAKGSFQDETLIEAVVDLIGEAIE